MGGEEKVLMDVWVGKWKEMDKKGFWSLSKALLANLE